MDMPDSHIMLDFIGLTLMLILSIRGYMKGIIVAVFSVLAIILGVVCALKLSGMLGGWLLAKGWVTTGWATIVSYVILFVCVVLLVRLMAKALQSVVQLTMLGWLNGLIGALLYGFMASVIWSSLLWIGNQAHLIAPETKAYSKTYRYLEPIAPWTFDQVGKLLPFAKDIFEDLTSLFEDVNQNLPEHVGNDR